MEGCIFNIQKFSLHDGPGIRSVVFLKGCPLRCAWCSNPESQDFHRQVIWDERKCVKCFHCIKEAKDNAVSYENNRIVAQFREDENYNVLCEHHALKVEGEKKSVDEVVEAVLKDEMFYEESGGGVTLSGGEVLSQPDFVMALCQKLKEKNIHIALETTGFAPFEVFAQVIKNVDLLLFDLKHYDTIKHEQACKVNNEMILYNMRYASTQKVDIIARIPVIPGFNDTLEDAYQFAQLLRSMDIDKVNLLPFHQFGMAKYTMLNKEYVYKDVPQLHNEDIAAYKEVMQKEGLQCE